jgi:hypothetical protein
MQIKDLCTSCNYLTITVIEHDRETATFTCSYCKNSFNLPWNNETRTLIRTLRGGGGQMKKIQKRNPELLKLLNQLKEPGDHIRVDPLPSAGQPTENK